MFHSETSPDRWLHIPAQQLKETLVTQKESRHEQSLERKTVASMSRLSLTSGRIAEAREQASVLASW